MSEIVNLRRIIAVVYLSILVASLAHAQSYDFIRLDDSSLLPDAGNELGWSTSQPPAINASGDVAFAMSTLGNRWAVFRSDGSAVTTISDTNSSPYVTFGPTVSINDAGIVAMPARLTADLLVVAGSGGPLTTIAQTQEDGTTPTTNTRVSINNAGLVAYSNAYRDDQGVPRTGLNVGSGGPLTTVVDESHPTYSFFFPSSPMLDDAGRVLFFSNYRTGDPINPTASGIFLAENGSVTELSEGPGRFSLNNAGQIAYSPSIARLPEEILLKSAGGLGTVLSSSLGINLESELSLNDHGRVAFVGDDAGGTRRLYLGSSGTTPDAILSAGTVLDGNVISNIRLSTESLNNSGQIAAQIFFEGGTSMHYRLDPVFRWANAVDGVFADGTKWAAGVVPNTADTATFDQSGMYTVTLDADTTVGETRVLTGDMTLDLNGAAFNGGKLTIGQPGSPVKFTISGGEDISVSVASASVPEDADPQFQPQHSTGSANSAVFPGFPVIVPHGSEFRIDNSADIQFSHYVWIEGTGEVTGQATLFADAMVIGDGETARFTVSYEGHLDANRLTLGDDQNFLLSGGSGTLVITNDGRATLDDVLVGDGGDGTIEILLGGKLTANKIAMADNLGSNARIVVDGYSGNPAANESRSTLTTSNWNIGKLGEADVLVTNGGVLTVDPNEGAKWTIHPDGSLSLANLEPALGGFPSAIWVPENAALEIQVGDRHVLGSDIALMVVSDGAVAATTAVIVGPHLPAAPGRAPEKASGQLTVLGLPALGFETPGRLEIHQELVVGENGIVDVLDGGGIFVGPSERILEEILRGTDVRDHVYVLDGGRLAVAGTINVANGIVHRRGSVVCLSGCDLETGSSPGAGTINADLVVEPGGRWIVEIAGLAPDTEHDQLIVGGDVTIDGTIVLKFLDGFAPQQGQQFEFLNVGGNADLSGASFEIHNLAPGFIYEITPSASGFMLTALNDGVFVPEPATVALLLSGLFSMGSGRRAAMS
ncbi:MAG: PEP-CTERM sorting domain-containing protein [Pirellulales bacterium]|nr:PEP-CTERM sorting domain-containing protein [Pirellulales bacterium]